ncbi:hypothetical protein, partial [Caulobacter sp. 17J65-9]|uniref:hypothetical protein n=1 Tax=Caulobacter sp. 17J65-9 TaxID=2709382 RepID=UPI0013C73120
ALDGDPLAPAPADLIAAAMFRGDPALLAMPAPAATPAAAAPVVVPVPILPIAAPPPDVVDAGFGAPVGEGDLDSMRGGFLVADGIAFDLGAVVRTLVDGQLALSTTLNWTPSGTQVSHQIGPTTVPATAEDLHAAAVLAGLDVKDLAGTDQVFLAEGGGTAFIHRVSGADFQNIVVNTDSGVEIRQETEVNLSLPGFDQTQRDWLFSLFGFRVGADLTNATSGAVGR